MKPILLGFLLSGLLTFAPAVYAQEFIPATVEFREKVQDEELAAGLLHHRALDWTDTHFTYLPKTTIRTDAAKGEIRVSGTMKVKTASPSGQMQEHPVLFEFFFHTLPVGYEYSVGYFRVVPDAKKPDETVPFEVDGELAGAAAGFDLSRQGSVAVMAAVPVAG